MCKNISVQFYLRAILFPLAQVFLCNFVRSFKFDSYPHFYTHSSEQLVGKITFFILNIIHPKLLFLALLGTTNFIKTFL